MKIYIKAYWFDDNEESADDFIYGRTPYSNEEPEEDLPYEILPDDPYEDNTGYGDFDDYEAYGYSEYEDFYRQILVL